MNKLAHILMVSMFAVLSVVCFAQDDRQTNSTMKFEYDAWDFKTINEVDGKVSHTFKFRNDGSEALVIEDVRVSCGCTEPKFSKAPVMPGKTGEILLTFDPEWRPGMFNKSVYISSRGGKNLNVLTLKGTVKGRPRSVEEDYPFLIAGGLRFDRLSLPHEQVAQGVPMSQTIGYANTSKSDVTLDFQVTAGAGLIDLSYAGTIPAGQKGDITVTFNVPVGGPYGRVQTRFYAVINGRRQHLSFSATAIVTDDFSGVDVKNAPYSLIEPNFYNFGYVPKGQTKRFVKEVELRNDGKSPLIVRGVRNGGGQETGCTLKPGTVVEVGRSHRFEVSLDVAKESTGLVRGVLDVVTNDPRHPLRKIQVVAEIVD